MMVEFIDAAITQCTVLASRWAIQIACVTPFSIDLHSIDDCFNRGWDVGRVTSRWVTSHRVLFRDDSGLCTANTNEKHQFNFDQDEENYLRYNTVLENVDDEKRCDNNGKK